MPAMQSSKGAALQTGSVNAAAVRNKPGLFDRIADHFRRYWQLWVLTAPALFFVGLFATCRCGASSLPSASSIRPRA